MHLFSLLWFAAFAIGCSEFIITGAVADWYYKQGSDRNSYDVEPVSDTWRRLRTYHLGSVALASGLIAMVSFIRFLLEYLYVMCAHICFVCRRALRHPANVKVI